MKPLGYFLAVLVMLLGLVSSASAGEKASNPSPPDGATCVDPDVVLIWSPGIYGNKHDVYLGTNFNDVSNAVTSTAGIYKGRQDSNSYNPGDLEESCKTYYWRIDEVHDCEPNIWKGDVWSFTTKGDDCCHCIVPPEGMVAWWPFDEEPGTTIANDIAGSINDQGTLINGASFTSGMVEGGLLLDGVNDYVDVPNSPELNFGEGNLSIDSWINTNSNESIIPIADKRSDTGVGYILFLSSGRLSIILADSDEWQNWNDPSSFDLRDGQWHHVAATVDRSDPNGGRLYIGGQLIHTFDPTSIEGNINNTHHLWIGRRCPVPGATSNKWFAGFIDEVELFNRALEADEIRDIFDANSEGKCKCQCGEWNDVEVTWMDSDPDTTDQWTGSCGESIEINNTEGESITATSSIACTPESCDPSYGWQVTGPGGFSDSGDQLPAEFVPPQDGMYEVLLYASCDGQECPSCNITLNVKIIRTVPSYPNDIKWSQPPEKDDNANINGWDELSSYKTEPIIADDWLCKDDRPIKDIHWWGSFKGWKERKLPPDAPTAFHIGIWTDVPDPDPNDPNNFSHPRKLIWENICNCSVGSFAGYDLDPRGEGENDACFLFDQLLSEDQWFYQESNEPNGTVYWLSIAAIYDGNTPEHPWGWKTRPHFYNDDAVRILPPVAFCPNDCPGPDYSGFLGGINDNYNTNNVEPTTPSPALAALFATKAKFDDLYVMNYHFGHTITSLPECIVRAELEIALQGTGSMACNDTISLQLTGGTPSFAWGRRIGTGGGTYCGGPAGLLGTTWDDGSTHTFTLNLSILPNLGGTTTDLLPLLNSTGHLDVYIQDDTAVDYMILHVWSCPLVTGQWPPKVGSFWKNGEPIEYPDGTSWDVAFVLTTNREYQPMKWWWPNEETRAADIYPDGIINLKDMAVLAGNWLTEGEIWPDFDMP